MKRIFDVDRAVVRYSEAFKVAVVRELEQEGRGTAEVLRDGWYSTGDIAALDEDGFLQITDRLSRFSKIRGEMVPHVKVEEKLHELASATEQSFVGPVWPMERKASDCWCCTSCPRHNCSRAGRNWRSPTCRACGGHARIASFMWTPFRS
ncbi:MAG: hypothetical protein GX456_04430 [Verrucomicrobia bacterium]|nr:hypothetical protein [Verrucomicrobiota bacterium]